MRLQQLEGLVALADAGSIRSAAKLLGISQPALTKSLHLLEEELGISLLLRTPRGVVLTEQGQKIHQRSRGIAADITRLKQEAAHMRGQMVGRVCLSVSPVAGILLVPALIKRFAKLMPEVQVDVQDGLYPAVLPQIRSGIVDLAIGPQPSSELIGSDLAAEALFTNNLVVAARIGHPQQHTTALKDLLSESWLLHGPETGPGSLFAPAFVANGLEPPKPAIRSTSFTTSIAILEDSDALCVLPERLIGHFQKRHQLLALPLKDQLPAWDICLLYRASVPLSSAAKAMATLIRRMPLASRP